MYKYSLPLPDFFFLMRRFQIGRKMTYSSRTDILRFSMKVKKRAAVIGYLMGGRDLWKSKTPREVGRVMEETGERDGKHSGGSVLSGHHFPPHLGNYRVPHALSVHR